MAASKVANKKKYIVYKEHDNLSGVVEFYYAGGFYQRNGYLYPKITPVKLKAKRYASKKHAQRGAVAASNIVNYYFKIKELEE